MKKLLSILLSALIVLSVVPLSAIPVSAADVQSGDYSYRVVAGKAWITKYHGNGGDVTIPSELDGYLVARISDSAFFGCDSLTSITIPDGVTSIGEFAFYGCDSLTSITIPDGVTSIGQYAFSSCDSLTSITIPDGVTSIGNGAFHYCQKLKRVYITDLSAWCKIDFIGFDANPLSNGADLYLNNKLVTDLVFPDGVTSIGDYAFSGCDSLTSITIPDGVTSVGTEAFSSCNSLTSITIPDSVTSIGNGAFSSCDSLTSITIPDGVTSIGTEAFNYCTSLTSITIPDGVTSIGDDAFNRCSSLTSITIPDSVTSIGYRAFRYCTSLTSITIPDSVTSIGDEAFSSCDASLTFRINRDSYAQQYANQHGIKTYFINIPTPSAPVIREVTSNSVTLIAHDGYEYKCNDGYWSKSNIFTGLTAGTKYTFYQRVAETNNSDVSDVSAPVQCYTIPVAPVLSSKDTTYITLVEKEHYEYSLDGKTWQKSGVFSNLTPETIYTFYQRINDQSINYISDPSVGLTVETFYAIITIYYDANGGSNAPPSMERIGKRKDEKIKLSYLEPNRDGYNFIGWSTTQNGTTIVEYSGNSDITLYAQWCLKCENCHGVGSISKPCSSCGGDGKVSSATGEKCDSCGGAGMRCQRCGTPRKFSIGTYSCSNCGYNRFYSCSSCGGSGNKLTQVNCGTCSGRGTISVECNVCKGTGNQQYLPGDVTGDDSVTDTDAIYLLMYTFFPEEYPVNQSCDFDGDGSVTEADAIYLLMYTFFPEEYPIEK